MSILLGILTFILVLVSVFLVFVVLAQKAKSDGGMGSAMGGGMAEAAFGAETSNVLSKATINAAIAFFVLSFVLYLGRIYQQKHSTSGAESTLPAIPVSVTPAPQPVAPAPLSATPAPEPAKQP